MAVQKKPTRLERQLLRKMEKLKIRLAEAEETLRAIREGEVDAVVVRGSKGEQIFSLSGSDAIYRLIVETMKEAAFTVASEGTILFSNSQFSQFVKRPLEQIVGRRLQEFVVPGDKPAISALLAAAQDRSTKQRLVFEATDGTAVPAHVSANVLHQPDGVSICVVATDLTELENSTDLVQQLRRQQEELQQANEELFTIQEELRCQSDELREAHERAEWLARLPQESPTPVVRASRKGTILYANAAAAFGDGWHCQAGHPLRGPLAKLCLDAMAHAEPLHRDLEIDGRTYLVSASPFPKEGYVNLYGRDDTERKQAADALRRSREEYRHLVEGSGSVILRSDKNLNITFMNQYGLEFFGYSEAELIGRNALGTIIPRADDQGNDLVSMAEDLQIHPEKYANNVHQNLRKDGSLVWMSWANKTLRDDQGEVVEILAVGNDLTKLKQAEAALGESRKRYQDLIETIGDFIWETDSAGRYTYCSPHMYKLWGIKPEEMIGKTPFEMMSAEHRKSALALYARMAQSPQPFSGLESTAYDGQGRLIYIETSGVPFFDDTGRLLGFRGISRDVTDRKRAEQTLRENETRLKAAEATQAERRHFYNVLETLPAMICLLTPEYKVDFANRAFRARFGESNGRRCYEYCFGRSEPCDFCETFSVLQTGEPHHWEVALPEGTVIDVHNFPFAHADGSPMILEMDLDITETRRAEAALREANAYNRTLIEASLDPLVTIGPDGRITDVNAATEHATGRNRKDLMGTDFSEYFTEPEMAKEGYQRVFREGTVRDYPLEICNRGGGTAPVLYNATLYHDADGQVLGVLAAARDIAELKRAEMALRDAHDTLERRVAERTEALARSNEELAAFAYVASHDLQEPLRMVIGFLNLLRERYKTNLDDKAREYIGYAVEGGERMSLLIKDLLEYSRIGRIGGELESMDAARAFSGALANLRDAIREAGATVTHDDLPTIAGDASQLIQLFQNLLGNAIKFRRSDRPCKVHVSAANKDGEWLFSIRDNGIGVAADQHERIFQIFQRLHTREMYPGTGIGLAICKKIVERHGGKIWVESDVAQGSTFYFTLREGRPR